MSDALKLDDCEVCAGLGYIQGIDTCCPHCRGEGKVDWIEQITGSSKVKLSNPPKGYMHTFVDGKTRKFNGKSWENVSKCNLCRL